MQKAHLEIEIFLKIPLLPLSIQSRTLIKEMQYYNWLFVIFYLQIDCQLNPVQSSDLKKTKEWRGY